MTPQRVLLVGGYGVVGAQVAGLLRKHHPALHLVIAGRRQAEAAAAAERLGNASALAISTAAIDPLASAENITAVAGLVHDPDDHLLSSEIRRGLPYADITRGIAAQTRAYVTAAQESLKAPVLFASNWMAGVPAILATAAAREFTTVDRIALSIFFDRNDKTGPDSASAGNDLAERMTVKSDGAWRTVKAMSAPARVTFPSGRTRTVYRMNMADVVTLAQATGAKDVAVRIGLDSDATSRTMRFLINAGLWGIVQSLPASTSPAHNPKAVGAAHEIVIEIAGTQGGKPQTRRLTLLDRKGQAHLTAIGAVAAIERILGLDGVPLRPGIATPETAPNATRLRELLQSEGVEAT